MSVFTIITNTGIVVIEVAPSLGRRLLDHLIRNTDAGANLYGQALGKASDATSLYDMVNSVTGGLMGGDVSNSIKSVGGFAFGVATGAATQAAVNVVLGGLAGSALVTNPAGWAVLAGAGAGILVGYYADQYYKNNYDAAMQEAGELAQKINDAIFGDGDGDDSAEDGKLKTYDPTGAYDPSKSNGSPGGGLPFDLGRNIHDFFKWLSQSLNLVDPLILDIDGDGIHTTNPDNSNAYFDFDGSGSRTHTGWISTGDGFLVLDRNHNGTIDSGAELFSNFTPLANGTLAANGFDALREFDLNRDGVIDRNDAIWSSLRIWRDANGDGTSQSGELLSLDELGIVSINLSKDATIRTLENGNMVRGSGSFVQMVDGVPVERDMQEIWFGQDTLHQRFDTAIPLRDDVIAMPYVQGAGNVRDLWQAASLDTPEGAALRTLLDQITQAKSAASQQALIEPLLKAWAATSSMTTSQLLKDAGKRTITGYASDADWIGRLTVLEKMSGSNRPAATIGNAGGGSSTSRSSYVGIRVTIPFFEGFGSTYRIREARAQAELQQANVAETEQQVALNVWKSYEAVRAGAQTMLQAQALQENAGLAFEAAQARYKAGVAGIIELLHAQDALIAANHQRIATQSDWFVARLSLAASLGKLDLGQIQNR